MGTAAREVVTEGTTPATEQTSTEPQSQPVVQPVVTQPTPPPSIDGAALRAELAAMGGNVMRDQAQKILELQQELANRNATPTTAPADDAARFLEAPRQMIREELQGVVAPLMEFMSGFKKNDAYASLKNEARQHPQLGRLLSEVEPHVDQLMANAEPNAQNLQTAILTAYGIKAAGLSGNAPNAPASTHVPPSQPVPKVTTPPYIPPSPPAPPRSGASDAAGLMQQKIAALTESEREVARRWGISLEAYITNRDAGEDATAWKGGTNV